MNHRVRLGAPAAMAKISLGLQRGAVSILTALLLPLVILVLVLGIDVSYALSEKNRLQGVADNAARAAVQIAGIEGVVAPLSYPMIQSEALGVASANGVNGTNAVITVTWPYDNNPKAVEVTISKNVGLFYGQTLNLPFVGDVRVRAVADTGQLPCLAALNTSNPTTGTVSLDSGINMSGNKTVLNAPCGIYSNRPDPNVSVELKGGARLVGTSLYMVGGSVSVDPADMPFRYPGSSAYKNPFQNQIDSIPSSPAGTSLDLQGQCAAGGLSGGVLTLSPGVYNAGMKIESTEFASGKSCAGTTKVTLQPGEYYVKSGFNMNANMTVEGTGVTIVLIDSGDFSMSDGKLMITAPTSGPYAGISVIGKGAGKSSGLQSTNPTIGTGGAIVLPNKDFKIAGGSTSSDGCFSLLASSVTISGSFGIGKGCDAASTSQSEQKTWRLVE